MLRSTISALPNASQLSTTDKFVVDQTDATRNITVAQMNQLYANKNEMETKLEEVNTQMEAKANKKLVISKNGNSIKIAHKYSPTHDMVIQIDDNNINKVPQLNGNYRVANSGANVTMNLENGDSYNTKNVTDWVGPLICKAVNNADGDKLDTNIFTGGMHGFNGGINDGSPTSNNVSIDVFVDGISQEGNFTTRCNNIRIRVKNEIQASNTVKQLGGGRTVLYETVTYTINEECKLDVKVLLQAKENIDIYCYYGMQGNFKGYLLAYEWAKIVYECDDMMYLKNLKANGDCGQNPCSKIFVEDRYDNCVILELKKVGLGTMTHKKATEPFAKHTEWAKSYFGCIGNFSNNEPLRLNRESILTWEGTYKFTTDKISYI